MNVSHSFLRVLILNLIFHGAILALSCIFMQYGGITWIEFLYVCSLLTPLSVLVNSFSGEF